MSHQPVRVFVAGDICPIGDLMAPLAQGRTDEVFGDVLPLIAGADYAVGNLECPLGRSLTPMRKSGPNLLADPACATALARAGFKALGIANNHIMDFGPEGLASSLEACKAAGLPTFGGGATLEEARPLHVVELKGLKVAFLAIAEDEACLASPGKAGANPLDPIPVVRTLREAAGTYDRLVVMLHGGNEFFPFPSPWLRDYCRFLVELGADVVTCQHTHCVGAMETYRDATILYGQGNFLFKYASHGSQGAEGLGLMIHFPDAGPAEVELHPLGRNPDGPGIRRQAPGQAETLLSGLRARSEVLADPARYRKAWEAYCQERRPAYFSKMLPFGRWFHRFNRRDWMFRFFSDSALIGLDNAIRCESHRAALRTGIDLHLGRDLRPD
ncbi:MAG TPA: CapA family protein [Holophagaceae bacterium]|nr:CapA family protein [Holophagaceae bacterium]